MNLRSYFNDTKNNSLPSQIIGCGEFRKKGSKIKNWKIRSYYIKNDRKLLYFDPLTKEPKGIFDISFVELSLGPIENLNKSGCSDFSVEVGHSIIMTSSSSSFSSLSSNKHMELVFDTTKVLKNFCCQLIHASPNNRSNILVCSFLLSHSHSFVLY